MMNENIFIICKKGTIPLILSVPHGGINKFEDILLERKIVQIHILSEYKYVYSIIPQIKLNLPLFNSKYIYLIIIKKR